MANDGANSGSQGTKPYSGPSVPQIKAESEHAQAMLAIKWQGAITLLIALAAIYIAVFNYATAKDALLALLPLLTLGLTNLREIISPKKSKSS